MAGVGVNQPDRKLAAEVRRLGLAKIKKIFEMAASEMSDKERQMHDELLLKMSSSFIPRLTEITGEDGEAIKIVFDKTFNESNTSSTPTGDNQAEGTI